MFTYGNAAQTPSYLSSYGSAFGSVGAASSPSGPAAYASAYGSAYNSAAAAQPFTNGQQVPTVLPLSFIRIKLIITNNYNKIINVTVKCKLFGFE